MQGVQALRVVARRAFSSTALRRNVSMKENFDAAKAGGSFPKTAGYIKVQRVQNELSIIDGNDVYVHLKKGGSDGMKAKGVYLYSLIMVPIIYGILWNMSWPQPVKEE